MTLLLFIAHLAKEGLAYTSIKVYLSAIRSMHVTSGHHLVFFSTVNSLSVASLAWNQERATQIWHKP